MKKDITYEQRVFTNRIVDVDSMSVGNFTSKNIKELSQKDKIDGRFFHTSDTDEWFFCWKGELQKLNLKGATLKDVKELIGKTEVLIENAKNTAESAIKSLGNKADKSVVDALSTKVDAIKLDEYATTSQVDERVAALVDGAPETLDTLNELSAALKDNADIVDLLTNSISVKQDKIDDLETIRSGANLGATALQVVPDEYVTETELEGMGYATTAQVDAKVDKDELKDYALKTDIKEPIEYTAGSNIDIIDNTISSKGYTYNDVINSFATVYANASGNCSNAEGYNTYATNNNSHAEGENTTSSGWASHSEGCDNTASGRASHVEGEFNIAQNESEHAEGHFNLSNKNSDEYGDSLNTQHSIGVGTDSNNRKNAFEVMQNGDTYLIGVGYYDGTNPNTSISLQEVINGKSYTAGDNIKIENNVISALIPSLENYYTKDETNTAITEELKDYALKTDIKEPIEYTSGDNIKIENNVISALIPSLENYYTKDETNTAITEELKDYALKTDIKEPIEYTSGDNIKIENNVISALIPSLENYYTKDETNTAITKELKDYALKTDIPSTLEFTKINSNNNLVKNSSIVTQLTIGSSLVSPNDNCLTVGRFNNAQTSWDAMLWVGSGSSESNRKNQMIVQENQVHYRGEIKEASGWIGDFGEYFEWYDGNPNNDDRVGYMVQLNENKIEYSTSFENCIGIISDTCIITGGCCSFEWHNMYLRDEFGRELKDENGESILNPEYNPEMQYVSRDKRKEWGKVGILGQIYTRQDGTLKVGGFAGCKDGIATDAESGYRVLKIINENVALLLVK